MTGPLDYPDDDDGQALARVAGTGSDMSAPMVIDFFVAAPDEERATSCRDRIVSRDFEAEICFDETNRSWTVSIPVNMVPDYDEIVHFQKVLNEDLAQFGCTVDGWGTHGNAQSAAEGGSDP